MLLPETSFTPWTSLLGGALIGLSSVMVMLLFGRIAGIIRLPETVCSTGSPVTSHTAIGAASRPMINAMRQYQSCAGTATACSALDAMPPAMAVAGLLVGFGSTLGSGCTSGHGVCGLARLSTRSLVAVLTFMAFGFATVFVLRNVIGGTV